MRHGAVVTPIAIQRHDSLIQSSTKSGDTSRRIMFREKHTLARTHSIQPNISLFLSYLSAQQGILVYERVCE